MPENLTVSVASDKQLFIDHCFIDSCDNLHLVVNTGAIGNTETCFVDPSLKKMW